MFIKGFPKNMGTYIFRFSSPVSQDHQAKVLSTGHLKHLVYFYFFYFIITHIIKETKLSMLVVYSFFLSMRKYKLPRFHHLKINTFLMYLLLENVLIYFSHINGYKFKSNNPLCTYDFLFKQHLFYSHQPENPQEKRQDSVVFEDMVTQTLFHHFLFPEFYRQHTKLGLVLGSIYKLQGI